MSSLLRTRAVVVVTVAAIEEVAGLAARQSTMIRIPTLKLKGTASTTVTPTGLSRNRWTRQSPSRRRWGKATMRFTYTTTQGQRMAKHTGQMATTILAIQT